MEQFTLFDYTRQPFKIKNKVRLIERIYECPNCGFDFSRIDAFEVEINFCPSCWEKIREVV